MIIITVGTVIMLTLIVLSGIKQSSRVNIAIVSLSLAALTVFILTGFPGAVKIGQ